MRTSSSTARMVRGATCRHVGAAPSAVGWAEEGGGGGGPGGILVDAAPSGLGPGDDARPQDELQQRHHQEQQQQQAAAFDPDVVVPAPPPPPPPPPHHHHQDTDATQAVGSDLPVEPTAELDAMVLDRVSKMVLGDDNAGGCVGSSEAPSPSTTSTSTSTALVVEDPLPPVGGGEDGTWSDETAAATGTAETMTAATAATARPPARRFRVRSASVTAIATGDTCTADGGEQRRGVNRNNKRDATDLTATPVTNNQTARPTGSAGTVPGDPTPSPVRDVGVHPLLWVGTAGSTSISSSTTTSSSSSSAGLLPRLSPPLGLRSPTSTCTTAGGILIPPRACLASSNSPTSTAATPTVTVETICCTTTTNTTNATTTATTNATPCPRHQLSKDGTSLTIDGGANGGRKRRMLKKRHRRSNASFLAGAGCGVININMSMSMNVASSSSSWEGNVAIPSNEGGGPAAVEDGGCLGGILPDLADILDGACGGGTEDVIDGIGGMATVRGSPCHANGIGGGGGCPHHPLAAGCGEGSSFPLPFWLVARAARRSGSTSSRPSSTTLSSGGISQGSSRPERSNHSPEPHPLARPKRPSAPTPPGASVMSQISCNVFDQRLDRLASGVQMPTARGTAAGSSGGNGLPPPPNLVPKFRASPLPFSANLRLTPQPRRAAASRKGISSRRVRTGAKSGGNLGATLSVSTGFGNSAAFSPHHPPLEGPPRYRQIGGSGGFPIPPVDSIGTMLRDHDKTCANRCMSNSL